MTRAQSRVLQLFVGTPASALKMHERYVKHNQVLDMEILCVNILHWTCIY